MRKAPDNEAVLSMDDVAAVVRMLGEVADPAGRQVGDLDATRARLLDGLAQLIDAVAWTWHHGRRNPDGNRIMIFASTARFQNQEQEVRTVHSLMDDRVREPMDRVIHPAFNEAIRHPAQQGHFTRVRQEMIADKAWYESALYRDCRVPVGLDEFLISIYPLETHVWSAVTFYRPLGEPPFGRRERALVHLILNNIDWLHRAGSDVQANEAGLTDLAPRPREVLMHLINGDSAKQIAHKLGLSIHTVHDHLKTIHRHFNVSSRSELLAKFIGGGGPVDSEVNEG